MVQESLKKNPEKGPNGDSAKKPEPGGGSCGSNFACWHWLQAVIQSDYTEVKTCCRLILGNPRSHRYVGRWDYWWKSLEYVWKITLCQRQLSSRPEIDMKLLQKRCICLPLMRQQLQQPFANSSLATEKTLRRSLPASWRQGWDVHNDT